MLLFVNLTVRVFFQTLRILIVKSFFYFFRLRLQKINKRIIWMPLLNLLIINKCRVFSNVYMIQHFPNIFKKCKKKNYIYYNLFLFFSTFVILDGIRFT